MPAVEYNQPTRPGPLFPRAENSLNRREPDGYYGTQGRKIPRNENGKVECQVCWEEYGWKREFVSTEGLRKHKENKHGKLSRGGRKPGKAGNKQSNADNEGRRTLKNPNVRVELHITLGHGLG